MSVVAEYSPGTSLLHRMPGGLKLAMLAAFGVVLVVFRGWWPPLVALAVPKTGRESLSTFHCATSAIRSA